MAGLVALRWSSILAARGGVEKEADIAFGKLCRAFQPAILAFVQHAAPAANADDVVRDFFAQLLKRRGEAANHALRGRFRLFLRGAIADFVRDNVKPERNARPPAVPPERAFDAAWAQVIIERAVSQLETESSATEAQALSFTELKPFLISTPTANDYARLAAQLKVPTNSLAVAVQRLKLRLNELLQTQVADTLLDPQLLGPEFNALRGSF